MLLLHLKRRVVRHADFCCSMVGEYHSLYEMQRRRLEGQVVSLTEERDLWSSVTYSLALKVRSHFYTFLSGFLNILVRPKQPRNKSK